MRIALELRFKDPRYGTPITMSTEIESPECPRIGEDIYFGAPYHPDKNPKFMSKSDPIRGKVVEVFRTFIGRHNRNAPSITVVLKPVPDEDDKTPARTLQVLAEEHELDFYSAREMDNTDV